MDQNPDISVVMGVYNGGKELSATVESILSQQGVNLEFIIVDDGSTDASLALLSTLSTKDQRLKIISQDNQGLTRALIRGCAAARGTLIARQDCGDTSAPGRLARQQALLNANEGVALVSCGALFVGPLGEPMYEVSSAVADATAGLRELDINKASGPAHHGTAMFRTADYVAAGGYRRDYYFAQDLDLWTRLAERGRHFAMHEILYVAKFALNSISSVQRKHQVMSSKLILECARRRRMGMSEAPILAEARTIRPDKTKRSSWARAASLYFVGTCLRKRADPRAADYFRDAVRTCPVHVKSFARMILG